MEEAVPVTTVANLIQLALAPVFLLAGIGAILNVLAHRLARVVDRSRVLEEKFASYREEDRARAAAEIGLLERRVRTVHMSISLCTGSALFVCVVVAILFVAEFADFPFGRTVAMLFVAAMLLLIAGLLLFLWEIRLARSALRLRL